MKLTIDNLDGLGPRDYSGLVEFGKTPPKILRKLNQPGAMEMSLVVGTSGLPVPSADGIVALIRADGSFVFTGRVTAVDPTYAGWGERGAICRYGLTAASDEVVLDQKTLPVRSAFVDRTAGDILKQLANEALPGGLDLTQAADVDVVAKYQPTPEKTWAAHAAEVGVMARGSYVALNGQIAFRGVAANSYVLDETAAGFSATGLKLKTHGTLVNDVTVVGRIEPQAYVKDYFVGDGVTLRFTLSQSPFTRTSSAVLDEEWTGTALSSLSWSAADPNAAVSVGLGKLHTAGGTGVDGQTSVVFAEKIDMGGGVYLQHGDTSFSAGSDGIIGGLYAGAVSIANCVAGFRVTPVAGQSSIQALVNGIATGTPLTTVAGHRYVLATRAYATEAYRRGVVFHSSNHPAGGGRGGATSSANVRVVLEVHDIDPNNPGSLVAAAVELFDGLVNGVPPECTYALVNAASMQFTVAFTRILRISDALVRSALLGQAYRTRLTGAQLDGAECSISGTSLQFFAAYAPAANEQIEVTYRSAGRAVARVMNPASIASLQNGVDDGRRGVVLTVKLPSPRTYADCVNAASAILDDRTHVGWAGEYDTWSSFLPGSAADIFPGDGLQVNVPSQVAPFAAVVREVLLEVADLSSELAKYKIVFANEAAEPIAFQFQSNSALALPAVTAVVQDAVVTFPADLVGAEITQVSSTTTTIDIGQGVPAGYGVEVRRTDSGWGPDIDQNLVGRFTVQGFTVPRLARRQDYFLRLFDGSVPPLYSQHSALLHIDYPF